MKNNPVRTVAEWVLLASVVASVISFVMFSNRSRMLRGMSATSQAEWAKFQNSRSIINNLVIEAVEYSKTHPDIDPVLESIGVKAPRNTPVRPGGK